jgi:hypothetical protein
VSGCASLAERAADSLASDLQRGVFDHDDPATVADGLPAYLLLLDGLISSRPENQRLLQAGANLYGAYAGNFSNDTARSRRLSERALGYARRATCIELDAVCAAMDGRVDPFKATLEEMPAAAVPLLSVLGTAWAGHIQAHSDDWAAIAALPKAQALIERVVILQPDHQRGLPWVYLGVLHSLRPAAVGGQPELARAAFEQAVSRSQGNNLMAKTLYAEHYARLQFDRELHDRLLDEVLAADPRQPGFTLINTIARQRAQQLKDSADDFF